MFAGGGGTSPGFTVVAGGQAGLGVAVGLGLMPVGLGDAPGVAGMEVAGLVPGGSAPPGGVPVGIVAVEPGVVAGIVPGVVVGGVVVPGDVLPGIVPADVPVLPALPVVLGTVWP
ncbi:MAG: hypothetical protein WBQ17_08640 [Rhizomicrobium sp.]